MSFMKKANEDIVKDVRNSIIDLSKTLEIACDPSRTITSEIIEYYKKRIEIENDYGSRMFRLGEKLTEKVQKMTPLFQFKDNMPDPRYELYNLLKVIELEVKDKAVATSMYCSAISNNIIPAINKYDEFITLKLNKNKKLLSTISENLIQEINTVFNKNQIYFKNVVNEKKSTEGYNTYLKRKNSKQVKNSDKKTQTLNKMDQTHKHDIINTDRSRNQYILAHYLCKSSIDLFFNRQASQIFLATNIKFGEFWSHVLAIYTTSLRQLNEVSNNNLKNFDNLAFSDDAESEVILERHKSKFVEKNIKFPLIISKKDRENKVRCYDPLKTEIQNELSVIQENIKKTQEELSACIKLNSEKKALKIQWDMENFTQDILKESKTRTHGRKNSLIPGFDYNEYLQTLENCMAIGMSFFNERIKISWIKQALDNTNDITNISSKETRDDKKYMEFGVDIVQHCTTYNVKIPTVITLCSKYLYSNDLLKTSGIFMTTPSVSNVKEISEFITENGYIKEGSNAATVCSIMKQYLRCMKNFINIPDFPKILSEIAYRTKIKYIEETKKIMYQLSVQSRDLIIFIAKFIRFIAQFSDINKMDLKNLSMIFAQTLFSQETSKENTLDYQTDVNVFFKLFCERIFEIFPDESQLLDFEVATKVPSEENTYVDIIDDGESYDTNNTDIADVQSKESTLKKDTPDNLSSSSISISDLPPPDESTLPNELLLRHEGASANGTHKSNKMSEKEK